MHSDQVAQVNPIERDTMQALHPLIQKIIEQNEAVLPEGFDSWALKSTRPDLTTFDHYQWPQPGGVAECDPAEIVVGSDGPCPSAYGDGLCVGLNWDAMASGGFPARTLLLVAYATKDILGRGDGKVRVSKAAVVAIVDGERLLAEHSKMQDLTGASLEGMKFNFSRMYGITLTSANIQRASFREAYLEDANFKWAEANHADFSHACMRGANFYASELGGAKFYGAQAEKALFESARLYDTTLEEIFARDANFMHLFAWYANFTAADLTGACFTAAELRETNFGGAILQNACVACARIENANFRNTQLNGADFSGSSFNGTDLRGADIRGANFSGCDLRGANITGLDFSVAKTEGARFDD